ncbi:TIGR04211 family SH3 domain-containing protein [Endozoicomonas sp. G2_1]|uniref:TIGR04211 family SH3 domain-containing protein n=1 Tax=Endozoicomonas sp. G2_1 TaxID=2821091 RepID=UPI001ADC919E|nr:TIGR04211 family SH3 domain-containing protein [Endozoicomonas sp. G2_1]MBO9489350.1 TIGR04211 family SH3 domain-containing protein [Endozoicomonas sp. G2_1]
MKTTFAIITSTLLAVSLWSTPISAQEADTATVQQYDTGYISDDLFIYLHAGAGNNYRIIGSVSSGSEIQITGQQKNGFSQIIDNKQRTGWIESKHLSTEPSLRTIIAELNSKIADQSDVEQRLNAELATSKQVSAELTQDNQQLKNSIKTLEQQLAEVRSQVDNQDAEAKKQWFFNGAIVLGIGLVLGIILPHLGGSKRRKADSWH